jgi:hypothetical protein
LPKTVHPFTRSYINEQGGFLNHSFDHFIPEGRHCWWSPPVCLQRWTKTPPHLKYSISGSS